MVRLPAMSPNLNAHAERFVLSIKSKCLGRIVPLGEMRHRLTIRHHVEHHHEERRHQGLGGKLIVEEQRADANDSPVACRERPGGMLRFYRRESA